MKVSCIFSFMYYSILSFSWIEALGSHIIIIINHSKFHLLQIMDFQNLADGLHFRFLWFQPFVLTLNFKLLMYSSNLILQNKTSQVYWHFVKLILLHFILLLKQENGTRGKYFFLSLLAIQAYHQHNSSIMYIHLLLISFYPINTSLGRFCQWIFLSSNKE